MSWDVELAANCLLELKNFYSNVFNEIKLYHGYYVISDWTAIIWLESGWKALPNVGKYELNTLVLIFVR